MAPLDSRASTAFWRSWRLSLVWNTMLWWVSWGQCRKFRPTPSSTVLVARQDFVAEGQSLPGKPPPVSCQHRPAAEAWVAPEDLRRWYTLGHQWPPWTDSARKDCVSCVMVLWMVGWLVNPKRLNTEVLACCVLTFGVFLVTWDVAATLVIFWKVTSCLHVWCYAHIVVVPLVLVQRHVIPQTGLYAPLWGLVAGSRNSSVEHLSSAAVGRSLGPLIPGVLSTSS